jgi:hypothetical protein
MGHPEIPRQISLVAQLLGLLQTLIKCRSVTNTSTALAHEKERSAEIFISSRSPSTTTVSRSVIGIAERAVPFIYLMLLAASGVALILILLSDHFYLT